MRVAGMMVRGHPALGDLNLDFRNAAGHAPETIVLAGENGCGKTALLELLYFALGNEDHSYHPFISTVQADVFVEFADDLPHLWEGMPSIFQYAPPPQWVGFPGFVIRAFQPHPHYDVHNGRVIVQNDTGRFIATRGTIGEILSNGFGAFLSEARTAFRIPSISSTSGLGLSSGNGNAALNTRTSDQLPISIAQLLVNLQAADDADLARWTRENIGAVVLADPVPSRIAPLRDGFARLMTDKRFEGVVREADQLTPIFAQSGRRVPLAQLSTGEMQIVIRGGFLLLEAENLAQAIIMIDEPEISLHPTWQNKILAFYEAIVRSRPDTFNQLIVATHSPYVVHGSATAKHVILKRTPEGQIYNDEQATFPSATPAEMAIAAFDLGEIDVIGRGVTLAIVTEGKTDAMILDTAWSKLRPTQPKPFVAVPSGGATAIKPMVGDDELCTGWLHTTLKPYGIERFLCLFDFDQRGYGQWNALIKAAGAEEISNDVATCAYRKRTGEMVWSALLPVPDHRRTYANFDLRAESDHEIENLFPDAQVPDYFNLIAHPGGVRIPKCPERKKAQFAEEVQGFPPEAFAAFEPIFALVDRVLA